MFTLPMFAFTNARCAQSAGSATIGSVCRLYTRRSTLLSSNLSTLRRPFSSVSITEEGSFETLEYRMFYEQGGKKISPWHDISLKACESAYNYINEIPKGTRAKMEIATDEDCTPIKQDIKKGALRYFNYGDIPFNYGCLPQTWEDPNTKHPATQYEGDNDPIDVVEISDEAMTMGAVEPVKVLGILAMIDEEETDWKVVALRTSHPLADKVNDIADVDVHFPGMTDKIREWFRMYKTADGKPENSFAFDGEAKDKSFAESIIMETNESYLHLLEGKIANPKNLNLAKKL